ncbi:MAG TPA: ParB/RepB/Spo0J family partition protein [Nitrososphaeraceae archaeon]|jgi:ParB family chromosome partitioning protein|nr:ParB/RepB/Spo0J family partition protein [Nitrososphaeraceae archaeon]
MQKIHSTSNSVIGVLENVDISKIKPFKYYYRNNLHEDMHELCYSIKEKGLLQPIIVRMTDDSKYEIVAGTRRYNACKMLGWRKILCHVVELDDKDAFEVSLMENIHSKNLNPIDEARAFKDYVSTYGWGGISELATKLGKSASYIDKRIRMLTFPENIIQSISNNEIKPSLAEELLPIKEKEHQSKLAELIKKRKLSSRQVRMLKDEMKNSEHPEEIFDFTTKIVDIDARTQKSFDKAIIAVRVAMNKLASIIEDVEDNWTVYEILMQHKNMLHSQIDILLKEKKKI